MNTGDKVKYCDLPYEIAGTRVVPGRSQPLPGGGVLRYPAQTRVYLKSLLTELMIEADPKDLEKL